MIGTAAMAPTSGIVHAIAVHRGKNGQPFSEDERALKEALFPHLVESIRQNRHLQLRRELLQTWEIRHTTATANRQGVLVDVEDRFVGALREERPNWRGARLPNPLVQQIAASDQ